MTFGQGTIRGKVRDANGETVIGAVLIVKGKTSIGTVTDLEGNYFLMIPDSAKNILVVSLMSYLTIEEPIHLLNNEILIKNFVMQSSSKEIKEVQITAKSVKARDYYVERIKKNSATSVDYISSETIKKTGDANVTAAVSRVTGVSTNGSFITVRGIGDRYVKTAINGMRIPTLDPFTNNIKLDLFPASLIDNIFITKTASPELPSDWAGAYLSIQTKDFPEQLSVNFESTVGYNSQSTFKDFITSQKSSTDWLGFDNGFREHDHTNFARAITRPSQYQEFVALGLGQYYNSLGVNQNNWGDGTQRGETYFKLGLVQLGLLPPALINDQNAYNQAKNLFETGDYHNRAFDILNAFVPATGRSFPDNWNTIYRKAPLNFSQSFSVGNQVLLFKRPLGFLLSYRYSSSVVYDANSIANRAGIASDGNGHLVNTVTSAVNQEVSKENNGWSALVNASYKINPNNSISLLFMPNFTGSNNIFSSIDSRDSTNFIVTRAQFYEQRKLLTYQLKTEHYLSASKIKIEFLSSYTNGKSSAPDFKNVQYYRNPFDNTYQIGPEIRDGIHRYYRYLSDNLFDSQLSVEHQLKSKPELLRKIKVGGAYQENNRRSDQNDYFINFGPNSNLSLQNNDLNQLFALNNFDIHNYVDPYGVHHETIDAFYSNSESPANNTFGYSKTSSGFLMTDYSINSRVRASGGLRLEHSKIFTDVALFDSLLYAVNDERRNYRDGLPLANPGEISETVLLPSVNVIYKLDPDEVAPVNLRFNFSQTIARPSIRELSDVAVFDNEFRAFVFGNSELKTVHINNYDLRFEKYLKSGNNFSLSIFYKDFRNHIELVKSVGYSWQNVDKSTVLGIELEGKKKFSRHFEWRANVSIIKSETNFVRSRLEINGGIKKFIPQDTISRAMFGQAPFVINSIFTYTEDSLGLSVSLSYNVQGPRLVVAADVKEVPDIYELPRHLIDLKISKTLNKHFVVSLAIRDLLNSPIRRAYDYSEGWILDYDKYHFGTNYNLSIAYKL